MIEGCSPESVGWLLEAPGDGVSRWMVAADFVSAQDPAYTPTRSPSVRDIPTRHDTTPSRRYVTPSRQGQFKWAVSLTERTTEPPSG